jgi:hypothetical protein
MPTPCRIQKARSVFYIPSANETDLVEFLVCIVAGIVANILAYLADAIVLATQWAARDEDAR